MSEAKKIFEEWKAKKSAAIAVLEQELKDKKKKLAELSKAKAKSTSAATTTKKGSTTESASTSTTSSSKKASAKDSSVDKNDGFVLDLAQDADSDAAESAPSG